MKTRSILLDALTIFVGSVLFAVAINVFTLPNRIAPGGATGLGTVIGYFIDFIPVGTIVFFINLPLLLIAWKIWGFKALLRTIIATTSTSLMIDILSSFLPTYTGDIFLAAVFGGVFSGAGIGIIYARGTTTGGSDLLAQIIRRKITFISYGSILIFVDAAVILTAAVAFRDFTSLLYSVVTIFVGGSVIDKILDGLDRAKLVQIISDKNDEISRQIIESLDRGATFINARGAYTGDNKDILFIVVKRFELHRLKMIVRSTDSKAFIIIGEVSEVLGEGFKEFVSERQ